MSKELDYVLGIPGVVHAMEGHGAVQDGCGWVIVACCRGDLATMSHKMREAGAQVHREIWVPWRTWTWLSNDDIFLMEYPNEQLLAEAMSYPFDANGLLKGSVLRFGSYDDPSLKNRLKIAAPFNAWRHEQ